jgi:8-amino-3,8-dideoxy-alpha-D-manno-octulosonate transaminase
MPEVSGAVALAQIRKLDTILQRTQRAQWSILNGLQQIIAGRPPATFALRNVPDPEGDCGIAVGVLLPDAAQAQSFRMALRAEGVGIGLVYGGKPVYNDPVLRSLRPGWTNGASLLREPRSPYLGSLCPRTEDLLDRSLMLSVTPDYTDEDARDVVHAFAKVAARG